MYKFNQYQNIINKHTFYGYMPTNNHKILTYVRIIPIKSYADNKHDWYGIHEHVRRHTDTVREWTTGYEG